MKKTIQSFIPAGCNLKEDSDVRTEGMVSMSEYLQKVAPVQPLSAMTVSATRQRALEYMLDHHDELLHVPGKMKAFPGLEDVSLDRKNHVITYTGSKTRGDYIPGTPIRPQFIVERHPELANLKEWKFYATMRLPFSEPWVFNMKTFNSRLEKSLKGPNYWFFINDESDVDTTAVFAAAMARKLEFITRGNWAMGALSYAFTRFIPIGSPIFVGAPNAKIYSSSNGDIESAIAGMVAPITEKISPTGSAVIYEGGVGVQTFIHEAIHHSWQEGAASTQSNLLRTTGKDLTFAPHWGTDDLAMAKQLYKLFDKHYRKMWGTVALRLIEAEEIKAKGGDDDLWDLWWTPLGEGNAYPIDETEYSGRRYIEEMFCRILTRCLYYNPKTCATDVLQEISGLYEVFIKDFANPVTFDNGEVAYNSVEMLQWLVTYMFGVREYCTFKSTEQTNAYKPNIAMDLYALNAIQFGNPSVLDATRNFQANHTADIKGKKETIKQITTANNDAEEFNVNWKYW